MRLTADEVDAIKAAAAETFGANVVVRLFGSRIDDSKRGGDIDLLIEVEEGQQDIRHESRFLSRLFTRIDEQRVDITYIVRGHSPSAFAAMVMPDAVPLQ